jgi:hypothetical protein
MHRWPIILLLLCLPFAVDASGKVLRADDARLAVLSAAADDGAVVLSVELDGQARIIELAPMRRLEQEFAAFVPAIARGEDRLYEGTVRDATGGWARLSRIDGEWTGLVHDGATLWFVDPASRHAALATARGLSPGVTIAYRSDDLDLPQGFDLGGAGEPLLPDHIPGAAAPAPLLLGAPRFLKLTLVLDTEFQAVHGASFASVAASILNGVDGLYRAQTDVQVSLHHLRTLASNGTLTSTAPDTLLDAFTALLPGSGIPFAGLAHLLSGKDFDDNTVGLAWVGSVCDTQGFGSGINQMTLGAAGNSAVLAHEIGHNFNSDHDSDGNACPASGFIMAAILKLDSPATSFSSCSLATFTQYLSQPRACLDTPPAQGEVLFANGFEP